MSAMSIARGNGHRETELHIKLFLPGIPGLLAFLRSSSVALLLRDRDLVATFFLKPIQIYFHSNVIAPFPIF